MSDDVCKACHGNATELYAISKQYLGINISQIICNILQVNSKTSFGNSLICSSCIINLFLINEKIDNLRRALAPPAKPMHSDIEWSSPNKTNSANSKDVRETRKRRHSSSVEINNANASPKSLHKKTKNCVEAVQEIIVVESIPAADKESTTNGVESSLLNEAIDERLSAELKKKGNKIPKRRNTIYNFDCEFCDFQTGIIKGMQQHLIVIHGVKTPRIFECKQCSIKYTTKQALNLHSKIHQSENYVETLKNGISQDVRVEVNIKTTNEILPGIKHVSAKSPVKPATPDARPSAQKLKNGQNLNSSDDIVTSKKPSSFSKSVKEKLFKCDECPMVYDSTFSLDIHRSKKHCFSAIQSDSESVQQYDGDTDDEYNETYLGISNGLNGQHLSEQEVPECDSDLDNEQQLIPSPKNSPLKLPKASNSISSVFSLKAKSDFNTKCEFCAIIFDSANNYANHLTSQHGIEKPRGLRSHMKNCHEQDINGTMNDDSDVEVSCFEATQSLQEHDDNASNSSMEFPFQLTKITPLPVKKTPDKQKIHCPQCDQVLDSMFGLQRHLKLEHINSDASIYVCDHCPAKYKYNKNLKRHKINQHSLKSQ